MNLRFQLNALILLVLSFFWLSGFGPFSSKTASTGNHPKSFPPAAYRPVHLAENFGNLPLAFEPNQGQTDSQVKFLAHGRGYSLFVTDQEAVLVLKKSSLAPSNRFLAKGTKNYPSPSVTSGPSTLTVIRMKVEGAQSGNLYEGMEKLPGISNYFVGKDPSKWRKGIPQYGRVQTAEVYPGVDLAYYGNQGQLEYDFTVKPGANPKAVRLSFTGSKSVKVTPQGDLELETSQGTLHFRAPSVYQGSKESKTPVEGRYLLGEDGKIGFEVKNYDRTQNLVIDPVLDYSSFLGGTGKDLASAIALDSSGDAYTTGYTQSGDFPVTNAGDPFFGGTQNAFVAEMNPAGTAFLYVTYLGGTGTDSGTGIAVDSSGDAFITGTTNSANFPITGNAYQLADSDPYGTVFVTELGPGGSSLIYSTFLGGTGNGGYGLGDYSGGIALDASGDIYLCGSTASADFPLQSPYQGAIGVGAALNIFVTKMNPSGSALLFSTYLGGSYYDAGYGLALDSGGDAYVTGFTYSPNFPLMNPAQYNFGGSGGFTLYSTQNAVAAEFNSTGSTLVYSTFLGGSNVDRGYGIAADGLGDTYVTGQTSSPTFPTQNAYQGTLSNSINNVFVSEIQPGGGAFVYSTFLGGSGNGSLGDSGSAIAVDSQGYAYVTGYTASPDFPQVNSLQTDLNGNGTAFIAQFNPQGAGLQYSTFLGGNTFEQGTGIAVDNFGNAYVAGYTWSPDFPTTVTPPYNVLAGQDDTFIAKISQPLPPTATPTFTVTDTPTVTPTFTETLTFTDTPTSTPTFTPTLTDTLTPTFTPSFTPTVTPTNTPTQTPTVTMTNTSTLTATITFTPTITSTATTTPTPVVLTVSIGAPYPNPVTGKGPILIPIQSPGGSTVQITVFTLAFRKIYEKSYPIPGQEGLFPWNLVDGYGRPLSNGLYYVRVQVLGPVNATAIKKILVIR